MKGLRTSQIAIPEEDEEKSTSSEIDESAARQSNEHDIIYKTLLDAVKRDDPEKCKAVCLQLHQAGKTLGDPEMRNPENGATALHVALDCKSKNVVKFFIHYSNEEFLMEECEVVIKNVHSKKTCLHFLVEIGDTHLFEQFLQTIKHGRVKDEFLRKTVLTEMQGQRPRHLSAIHLASLYGQHCYIGHAY